jgi:hypothetical protein
MMRPRDWFLVGLRLFSIWVFYNGFGYFIGYFAERIDMWLPQNLTQQLSQPSSRSRYYLAFSVGEFAFAFLLLAYDEKLTRWLFDDPADENAADVDGSEL